MSTFDGNGTLYIPVEEWHEFIQKRFPFLSNKQYVLGNPTVNADDVEIPYAIGTDDVHPKEWAVKPEWMKDFYPGSK